MIDRAGYTTSGRNGGKSSAVKKAAPAVKKTVPAAKSKVSKSPAKPASKFPSSMSVPGSSKPSSSKAIPATGRDRFNKSSSTFGPAAKSISNRPGINRQEVEAGVMSKMRRDRLGPGQR